MNIYEFAMQMERDGERFYRNLADGSSNQGMSRILTWLADDEAKHYIIVKKMAEDVAPDMDKTTVLTDAKNVFAQMQGTSLDLGGLQVEVYRQAQEIERKSREFYEEQADQATKASTRTILLEIADEERRHYFLLDQIVEFLDRPSTWIEDAEFNRLGDY